MVKGEIRGRFNPQRAPSGGSRDNKGGMIRVNREAMNTPEGGIRDNRGIIEEVISEEIVVRLRPYHEQEGRGERRLGWMVQGGRGSCGA